MLAPLSWLKEYVDIDVDNQTLKQKLFSSGFEVEEVIEIGKELKGVYVGLVESCKKLEGTHLSVCIVNVGEKGTFQICCGADNVQAGKKYPVALEGATVFMQSKQNGNIKEIVTIKNTKIRGVDSFGMLCSGNELGLTENMYQGSDYDGLLELEDSLKVGEDFKKAINLTDFVFDIAVTANRPDCQSILGIAREVSALLEKPLKMPEIIDDIFEMAANFTVNIESFEACPRYEAQVITDVKIEKSPLWLRKRLELVGVKPINNMVDITNYVLKEIGQPLHAFDKEKIENDKIFVKNAQKDEKFVALNEEEYSLSNNNLVISNGNKTLALAGVMGSLESGINESTKQVILESAKFERSLVRKTARELGLISEASTRFEKGVDEFSVNLGRKRAIYLLQLLSAGKACSQPIIVAENKQILEKKVVASIKKINCILGIVVPQKEILRILTNLALKPQIFEDELTVTVPAYRSDLETYQDLAEEIIRFYGYDNIKGDFLKFASVTAGQKTKNQKIKDKMRAFLYGQGYMESVTYSFFSPKDLDIIKIPEKHKLRETIKLLNPLKENISRMRTTLMPAMLTSLVRNIKRNNGSGRLFEIAKVFFAKQLPLEEYPEEKEVLALGMFGKDETYFTLKGTIEALGEESGIEFEFERATQPFLHPGISANILIKDEIVGYFGSIAHDIREEMSVEKQFFVAEIDYYKLLPFIKEKIEFKNISNTIIIRRDLALVAEASLTNGEIEKVIKKSSENIIKVELFDIYKGEQIEKNQKSVAYHIDLELLEDEFLEENANELMKKILKNLKDKLQIEIRQ